MSRTVLQTIEYMDLQLNEVGAREDDGVETYPTKVTGYRRTTFAKRYKVRVQSTVKETLGRSRGSDNTREDGDWSERAPYIGASYQ